MEQVYASALWSVIERGMTYDKAVRSMHESLVAQGRAELMPKIAKAFARHAERELQKSRLILSVAQEKDEAHARREAKRALEEMGATSANMDVRVDAQLIGGWRLEGGGHLIDRSWKVQLLSIYNRVTQNL